jgi:hypothetical protein
VFHFASDDFAFHTAPFTPNQNMCRKFLKNNAHISDTIKKSTEKYGYANSIDLKNISFLYFKMTEYGRWRCFCFRFFWFWAGSLIYGISKLSTWFEIFIDYIALLSKMADSKCSKFFTSFLCSK